MGSIFYAHNMGEIAQKNKKKIKEYRADPAREFAEFVRIVAIAVFVFAGIFTCSAAEQLRKGGHVFPGVGAAIFYIFGIYVLSLCYKHFKKYGIQWPREAEKLEKINKMLHDIMLQKNEKSSGELHELEKYSGQSDQYWLSGYF